MSYCNYNIIVTTRLGMEKMVEAMIKEVLPEAKVLAAPMGFKGLVLVESPSPREDAENILEKVLFAEKVAVVEECTKADINSIRDAAARIVKGRISPNETFAVRTIRRGKHDFTSIDVNIAVGSRVQEETGAQVNLEYPDKIVLINIVGDTAFLSIVPGTFFYKKKAPGKPQLYKVFRRLIIAQEPYLGPLDACFKMGERVGRALQNFEVGTYIVALTRETDAPPLTKFLEGVLEGIESRYSVQTRSYGREVHKTRVLVYEMHEIVRMYHDHPIIVLEPEGSFVRDVKDELQQLLLRGKRPLILMGSREGVPSSLYRYANLIVDVAPGITLSTEYALPTALGAIAAVLEVEENG